MSGLPSGWATANIAQSATWSAVKHQARQSRVLGQWNSALGIAKDMKVFDLADSRNPISPETAISSGGMNLLPAQSILMVTRSGILSHTFRLQSREIRPLSIKTSRPLPQRGFQYTLSGLQPQVTAKSNTERLRQVGNNC